MEPTSSTERARAFSREHGRILLDVAAAAIERGVREGREPDVELRDFPRELRARRAAFVTIKLDGDLIGCIGSLEPRRPLVVDVAKNAYAAAFHDPRSPGVSVSDLPHLDLHISVLGTPEPVDFADERDLVGRLRPGVDGLILEDGYNRGTFLPSVWESLPDPHDFVVHLKMKAGLPPTYWSDTLKVWRYEAESIP